MTDLPGKMGIQPFPTLRQKVGALLLSKNNPIRAAYFFGFASLSSWMPMFNLWLEDKGFSGIQIGYIAAIPWLLMLVVQPVWGIIADKYGKLVCFKISLIGAAILFVLFPLVRPGITITAAMTITLSLLNTPVLPLLDSIALDQVEERKNISYANLRFWGAPGYGTGALLTGVLIPHFGVQAAFFSSAVFLILAYLCSMCFVRSKSLYNALEVELKGLGKIVTSKILFIFLVIVAIVSIGQASITFFLTLYMREIGASPETTGIAIGMEGLSELPFYFIAAWLLNRMAPGKVVLIAIFATALRLFLYSINSNPDLVIFIEAMNGITWTLLWISSVEFVNDRVPSKWRTTGQSLLWASYFGAGAVAGNIVNGWLFDQISMQRVYGYNSLMILMTGMLALVVLFSNHKKSISMQ